LKASSLRGAAFALKGERTGHDPDGEYAERSRDFSDHRSSAGASATTFARGDEDHVGVGERVFDFRAVVLGGLTSDLGIATRAEPTRELTSDVEFEVGFTEQERLGVGVGRDELDIAKSFGDHPVHGVDTTTTHADYLDNSVVVALVQTHELPLG
jgi:hypothetical protein